MAYIDQFGIPSDVSNAMGSAPFISSRDEVAAKTAQQRADKWRKALAAFSSGLGASLSQPTGGGALLAGVSGGLMGGEQYQQHQDQFNFERDRQAIAKAIADREAANREAAQQETVRHNQVIEAFKSGGPAPQRQYTQQPWFLDPNVDPVIAAKAQAKAFSPTGGGAAEDTPVIDDQTLNDYADALATTGAFPNLGGFDKYGTKVKMLIGQRASQRHPGLNIGKVASAYKANTAALAKMTQASAGLEAFSETANRNTDILLETADSIPEFGNRFMNSAARKAAAALGDPNVARFNTALETVVPEFARILQSGGQIGGQQLTDAQKKDMRAVLHGDFTKAQLRVSVDILKREVANRKAAQEKSMQELQDKITPSTGFGAAGVGAPEPQQSSGTDTVWKRDASGKLVRVQ